MNPSQMPQGAPGGFQGGQMPPGGFPGGPPGGPGGRGMLLGMLPGGPMTAMIIVGLYLVTLVVLAIVFFKLFEKAGFNGAMGLLMIVPVVNLGVALYLAFTQWPVLTELAQAKLQLASVGVGGPGAVAAQVAAAVPPVAAPVLDPAQPTGA